MKEPVLVIMAAGMSRRFGRLKQTEPVGPNGECLLDFTVYDAIKAGFKHIVLVIRSEIEADIKQSVGARLEPHVQLTYVLQDQADELGAPARQKPWGTGHAVLSALKATNNANFGVINADDFYGLRSLTLLYRQLKSGDNAALIGYKLKNTLSRNGTVSRGICSMDEAGNVLNIQELTGIAADASGIFAGSSEQRIDLTGDEIVSVNLWAISQSAANGMQTAWQEFLADHAEDAEFYLPDSIGGQIAAGALTVAVVPTDDKWYGITHPGDEFIVSQRLAEMDYPRPLWG